MTGKPSAQARPFRAGLAHQFRSTECARWSLLLLDVLSDDRQRCAAAGRGEVGRRPQVSVHRVLPRPRTHHVRGAVERQDDQLAEVSAPCRAQAPQSAAESFPQGERFEQPRQSAPAGSEGARQSQGRTDRLGAQTIHDDHPRQPSGVRRGLVHRRVGADPVGEVRPRRRLGVVSSHVGGQGHPVRADVSQDGPLLSVEPDVLGMWCCRWSETAIGSGVDLRVWRCPRPRPERGKEHPRGRTGREAKRLRRDHKSCRLAEGESR